MDEPVMRTVTQRGQSNISIPSPLNRATTNPGIFSFTILPLIMLIESGLPVKEDGEMHHL